MCKNYAVFRVDGMRSRKIRFVGLIILMMIAESLFLSVPPSQGQPSDASRDITDNDFVPEQLNIIETLVVLVRYSERPKRDFDLQDHWDKIFGVEDPLTQLNAYYYENFYGQLQLQPVSSPEIGSKGYVEVELEGAPQDYSFGWLIGLEGADLDVVDPAMVQKVILDIMSKVVEKHPEIDYQDKFLFVVLDAYSAEYGRGAMGAIPSGDVYDLFVGEISNDELNMYSNEDYFRIVDSSKVVGLVMKTGYTFDDYFANRSQHLMNDQFIRGMAIFDKQAPLSCASHDILHGLKRQSASADPPEGRDRAVHCLYNLPLQSQWVVGTENGSFDRSIICSPYIGWWDPMGDHLHPTTPRDFFAGHAHGMCAFTMLSMGLIPDRCITVVDEEETTIKLAPLSKPELPAVGSEAETIVIKVPLSQYYENLDYIYLLLEYRMRYGTGPEDFHPDNFIIDPDYVFGDKKTDPGYNFEDPESSVYTNPPMRFVPDEGVLVYLVNEKMPWAPGMEYQEWYTYRICLLNPEGNEKRDNLNNVALDSGETMEVDFNTLYAHAGVPITITITVKSRTNEFAEVHIKATLPETEEEGRRIPGFPLEGVIIGIGIAGVALYMIRKNRREAEVTPFPTSFT